MFNLWTSPYNKQAGFTLLEVLVALLVIAIATSIAFKTTSDSRDRLARASREQEAVILAQSVLAHLGHDIQLQPGRTTGLSGDFQYHVAIGSAIMDPPPTYGLAAYPVSVTIEWRDPLAARALRLQTVRLGPTGSDYD